jgi:hypothetical protein
MGRGGEDENDTIFVSNEVIESQRGRMKIAIYILGITVQED